MNSTISESAMKAANDAANRLRPGHSNAHGSPDTLADTAKSTGRRPAMNALYPEWNAGAGLLKSRKTADAGPDSSRDRNNPVTNAGRKQTHPAEDKTVCKAAEKPDQSAKRAPERYEWTLPDGVQSLDGHLLNRFEPVARQLNLTNDQANRLLALYATELLPSLIARHRQSVNGQRQQWFDQIRQDPELGGFHLDANAKIAQRAAADFGSPELMALLNETGLGNHPAVFRCFLNIGRAMCEDRAIIDNRAAAPRRYGPQLLYGNMPGND